MLQRAHEVVAAQVASQCPNLARLAAAGRLLVIMLVNSQAPGTQFQRTVAKHLESIPEELASVRYEVEKLARGVAEIASSLRDQKK